MLLGHKAQLVAESAMLRMELQVSVWSRANFTVGGVGVSLAICLDSRHYSPSPLLLLLLGSRV